jgi:hypothetical protein
MGNKSSKTGPAQNLPPTIKEDDKLYIGGHGTLMQWSVSKKKVTKDYGKIMEGFIRSMV